MQESSIDPIVIMYRDISDGDENPSERPIVTSINKSRFSYKAFGLMICDLARHVALAYDVNEDDVWDWVDRERYKHTTEISQSS